MIVTSRNSLTHENIEHDKVNMIQVINKQAGAT